MCSCTQSWYRIYYRRKGYCFSSLSSEKVRSKNQTLKYRSSSNSENISNVLLFFANLIGLPLSFSLLLIIQLGFLSPIQYSRDLAHLSAFYPLSISFFIEIDISSLLLQFPIISRCNIYLGICIVKDSQENAVDMVIPKNKIYSGKRRVCPDFEKLRKKFI